MSTPEGEPPGPPIPPHLPARFADPSQRLPPGSAEFLRRTPASTNPAEPRPSSTVVLLRDGPTGLEAYLLRRVATMAFAAGMTAFPGGSVDPRDRDLPPPKLVGCDLGHWSELLTADLGLTGALVCAAVRETFEESGVLLAGSGPDDVVSDTATAEWEADRTALLDRSLSLAELLTRRGLVLRADLLRPWAHWITPEVEKRRYDTRFFVAALPAGQHTRDVGGEADRVQWRSPVDALRAADTGELVMLPPTAFTLAELSAYPNVEAVLAAGTQRDIRPVLPRIVVTGETAELLLPHEPAGGQAG